EKDKRENDLPHHSKLETQRQRILTNPGGDHHVKRLAEVLGVNQSYYCRLFTRQFGISPRQFVTEVRMDTARHLLRDTTSPIHTIAQTLGYKDIQFFSRHFRSNNGLSPREYRSGRNGPAGGMRK